MAYLNSHKELVVWQKSMDLALLIFDLTSKYPKSEIYGLISQMRRSSVSIPSNIAEGYGRRSKKEFVHFLTVSYGSTLELETQSILSKNLKFVEKNKFGKTMSLVEEILKMLNSMITKLKKD